MGGLFWQQADPVSAYFKALQKWLEVPVTSRWDQPTHEAILRFAHDQDPLVPPDAPWGGDPESIAEWAAGLLDLAAESESTFYRMQGFCSALGFPASNYEAFAGFASQLSSEDRTLLDSIGNAIKAAVVAAEREAPPQAASAPVVPPVEQGAQPSEASPAAPSPATTAGPTTGPSIAVVKPAPTLGERWGKLSKGKKALIVLSALGVTAGVGYGIWYWYKGRSGSGTAGLAGDCDCARRPARKGRR